MKTLTKQENRKITIKGRVLIILGAILFPALILLPFLMHSSRFFLVVAYSAVDGSTPPGGCFSGNSLVKANQCINWLSPATGLLVWSGALALLALGVLTMAYTKQQNRQAFKHFISIHALAAVTVAVSSIIVYTLMRGHSQAGGFFSATQLANDKYVVTHPPALGFGLSPYHIILLCALYVLVPLANLINWYRPRLDRRYIGGVKKEKLFQ